MLFTGLTNSLLRFPCNNEREKCDPSRKLVEKKDLNVGPIEDY